MLEKQIVGVRKLWVAVIISGIRALKSSEDREVLRAAKYFFTEGNGEGLRTFNGVCRVYGLDPQRAAKKIWEDLKPSQQDWIKKLLRRRGYKVQVN